MSTPLIPDLEIVDTRMMGDCWLEIARVIERSLMDCGAVPGEDYTYLDLYKLAQPIVIEQLRNDETKL